MSALRRSNGVTAAEILFRTGELVRTLVERAGLARGRRLTGGRGHPPPAPEVLVESFRNAETTRELWKHLFPGAVERSITTADRILRNEIPLFSDWVDWGREIDWHRDYRSGTRAPLSFGRGLDTLDGRTVGDSKNIWELNRFGYLVSLGQAFWATGDRRYFEKWRTLVDSWIDVNPLDRGVNWSSSLELAVRAVNWIWSSWFFRAELESNREFALRFGESLLLQGDRIGRHLSYYFSPNTHLTGEALGLLYIGKTYPSAARARALATLGERILRAELGRQILPDGGYFERATWYHKYTIDFYIHLLLLAGAEDARADGTAAGLKRMTRHLALLSAPDGTIPLIGDADGGQLLFLDGRKGNIRAACSSAAVLLDDGELKGLAVGEFAEETLWLLGPSALERFERIERIAPESYHSLNEQTGWYCLRSGIGARDPFLIFDCGPHGWGRCGHAHADMLSVLLYGSGAAVLADPGNPAYGGDPALRDRMRSSSCHSTITIGGESQSVPGALFGWRRVARPVSPSSAVDGEYGFVEGQHDGYDGFGCRHWRGVLFLGGALVVVADVVSCARSVSSILYNLQFGEGALEPAGEGLFRFTPPGGAGAHGIRVFGAPAPRPTAVDGVLSTDYNRVVSAPRIAWEHGPAAGDVIILTLLSGDADALSGFVFDGRGGLRGAAGGKRFAFSIEAAQGEPGTLHVVPRVTASVETADETRAFSLNAGEANGWRRRSSSPRRGS